MQTIHYKDVVIPQERQRKEFDPASLEELRLSILKPFGLLQPIVLRDDNVTLVCGERRLRAIELIYSGERSPPDEELPNWEFLHNGEPVPTGYIPYVRLSQLSLELLREAELEENVRRVDLTWQERVRAQAELHEHLTIQNPVGALVGPVVGVPL